MPRAEPRTPYLWLAAHNGERLAASVDELAAPLPAIDEPEAVLTVSFVGLTEAQQRAALAGFPGGRRFRLAIEREREAG